MIKQGRLGILLFLVAVIAWLGVVRSQVQTFSDRLLQAKVKQVEVDSYETRKKDIDFVKQQGDVIQGTLRALYLAMPKSSQIPEVLVMIESLGNSAGVSFGSASIGSPTGSEVPVSISFSGNISTVNKFLDSVHDNIRTAVIRSQSINADSSGLINASLQLGLVYQGGQAK